jgi:hypothetical protein
MRLPWRFAGSKVQRVKRFGAATATAVFGNRRRTTSRLANRKHGRRRNWHFKGDTVLKLRASITKRRTATCDRSFPEAE